MYHSHRPVSLHAGIRSILCVPIALAGLAALTVGSLLPAAGLLGATAASAANRSNRLPSCPLASLKKSTAPVKIVFWDATGSVNATALTQLTTQFNSSQSKVHATLVDLNTYPAVWQKYQAGLTNGQLPAMMQLTQIDLQGAIDTKSILPAQSCINAAHYATKDYLPRALSYWKVNGVQEALPFAVSGPVVLYNKQAFSKAGLNPNQPPKTLGRFMSDAAALKSHGSGTALVLDSWHLETWLATANKVFVNNGNGRTGRATKAAFDSPTGKKIWTDLDHLVRSGDAVTNPSSGPDALDNLQGIGTGKYGMTIDSSADLGGITADLKNYPNVTLGVGPFPVLNTRKPGGVEPGGSALYISDRVPAVQQAAAWTFETFLDSAATQATWAADTGYIPVRESATKSATITHLWATNPGFRVAYDQLANGPTSAATSGAVIGPYPAVRTAVLDAEESMYQHGVSPSAALAAAQRTVDSIISTYDQRLTGT